MITLSRQMATAGCVLLSALLWNGAAAESLSTAGALRVALTLDEKISPAERGFYEGRGHAPIWLEPDGKATPAANALLAWVKKAEANALPAGRYPVAELAARLAEARHGAYSHAAALELDLTRLFLTYGREISSGVLEPREVNRNIDIEPRRPAPAALLAGLATAPDIPAYLDGLAPADPAYGRLIALYAELRQMAGEGDWGEPVATGPTLRPGDRDPRIRQLRARLTALGDLPTVQEFAAGEVMNDATPARGDPLLFDPALEAAVQRFQTRHGLNTDGVVGPMTLAALNTSAAERAQQAAVNLERLRWLNYDLGWRHVLINTAAFTMALMENGAPRFTTRTVVGKARRHQTPEFIDELEYIVVNPTWNVPFSIATKEILPLLQENPAYLLENNMELLGSDLPVSEIDWTQVTRQSFPGRLRQRPGPGNALGAVKFLFPNRHSIYMHDTPARRLFAKDRRDYSHGCVRLQDPVEFAHLLLSLQDDDPVGTFDRLRASPGERWVEMHEAIPVYVTYRTTWREADGTPQFRADVYRRDRDVAAALGAAGVWTAGG
jgi:murein L,D-transpeptidase YcbB/YkuD